MNMETGSWNPVLDSTYDSNQRWKIAASLLSRMVIGKSARLQEKEREKEKQKGSKRARASVLFSMKRLGELR